MSPSPKTSASGGSTESLLTEVETAPENEGEAKRFIILSFFLFIDFINYVLNFFEEVESITSAEGVALSLLSKFSGKHLPKASEIVWLVSEKDAPQQV